MTKEERRNLLRLCINLPFPSCPTNNSATDCLHFVLQLSSYAYKNTCIGESIQKNGDFGENQMQKDITLGEKYLQKYVHIREGNV